jgi:hypothetical protein
MNRQRWFASSLLATGVVVLLAAILIGEHMGDRVMMQTTEAQNSQNGGLAPAPLVTPVAVPTTAPYGPDWKVTQAMAAAPDPHFPDPRVPPVPIPTLKPSPSPSPTPKWTPNPNIPIWDQTPPPAAGTGSPPASATPSASPSPVPAPTLETTVPLPGSTPF